MKAILILLFIPLLSLGQINDNWDAVKVGAQDMHKIYVGADLVWQKQTGTLATVTTTTPTDIYNFGATTGGNVTNDGGSTVTARGVCWSTSSSPTIANSHTTDGAGTGSFVSEITTGTCGVTYYVRAYATNSSGTAYGGQESFYSTSVNLPLVNSMHRVYSADCPQYDIDIISQATAEDAADLYEFLISDPCRASAVGYGFKCTDLSVGVQVYAFAECAIPPSYVLNKWRIYRVGAGHYKIIFINSSGVITTVNDYYN